MEFQQQIENAIRDGIREGVKTQLTRGYDNPLDKVIKSILESQSSAFRSVLEDAIASCAKDADFRQEIAAAVRTNLAKCLVQRFGGEVEKQVNALKSDPTTRARITLAIEEIVRTKTN